MNKLLYFILFILLGNIAVGQQDIPVLLKIHALVDQEFYEDAIVLSTEEIKKDTDYRIFISRGEAYYLTGDIASALQDYNYANGMKPGSASLNLARAYADMGDVGLSIQHLENHLISDFKTEERKLLLDPHLEKIENSPEWRRLWKTDWFTSLEKGISEIEYQIGRGQVSEARSALKDLSFFYKESPEINYLSGILSYGEGDYKSAVGFLSDAIAGDYKEYKVWLSYINAQKESAAYLNAVSACNEAMEIYPDRSELYLLRLECNRKAGERQKALNDAKLILQLYPNNEDAIRNAGKLAYENKQYTESLKYLSINIKNQPGNSQYFTDRASVYMATRSWDFAVYDYSMALDLQPMDGEAYYNKAYALLQLGKTEDACHDLKLALKYGNRKASSLINKNCIK